MDYIARYQLKEKKGKVEAEVQGLKDHLLEVSCLAESYGARINCQKLMKLAGVIHDIGKFSPAFVTYIKDKLELERSAHGRVTAPLGEKVDHGVYGAKFIFERYHKAGGYATITAEILLLICCYHHGGLPSAVTDTGQAAAIERISKITAAEMEAVLRIFQKEVKIDLDELFKEAVKEVEEVLGRMNKQGLTEDQFFYQLLIKLLYSMLVDADRVDSMCFELGEGEWKRYLLQRGSRIQSYQKYQSRLEETYISFRRQKPEHGNMKKVNEIRNAIADECLAAAKKAGGVYRLSVPTGGGKTLASMRFALEHSIQNRKDGIFYFLPFTTITSQNAEVFCKVLGEDCDLLEHHSNVVNEQQGEEYQLLTTRWENDIVVSTTVQFLNTFYAKGTQDVRRLHHMLHSVMIFDEVQTIPINCMNLFRSAVRFLTEFMDVTVVLCTATQPPEEDERLRPLCKAPIKDLTNNVEVAFTELHRVKVVDEIRINPYLIDEMADYIMSKKRNVKSLLIVLNKVKSVAQVYEALSARGLEAVKLFHLSSSMAPEHKADILKDLKTALEKGESLICVSTATIEAGVDISFEAGIRNLTKLDSIAQTAGRINRNGEQELGYCYVINLNEGSYSKLIEIEVGGKKSRGILEDFEDVLLPNAIDSYFNSFYSDQEIYRQFNYPDKNRNLYELLTNTRNAGKYGYFNEDGQGYPLFFCIQFAQAAKAFAVIKDFTHSLVVPYKDGKNLINDIVTLDNFTPIAIKKKWLNEAKKYTVNVYDYTIKELQAQGAVSFHSQLGIYLLADGYYHEQTGLVMEARSDSFMI